MKDFQPKNNRDGRGRRGGGREVKSEYNHKVLDIARVARVTKGGKRFSFRATVVVGDEKGKVGVGVAQGKDVAQSVEKSINDAKKNFFTIPLIKTTIPHEVLNKYKSAIVLLKPAEEGHGVKAGGPVRVVAQLAGIKNLTGKLISRTNNKINIARCTIEALKKLKSKNLKNPVINLEPPSQGIEVKTE